MPSLHGPKIAALSIAFALIATPSASGQASYFEGFNHTTTAPLEADGWIFRNQSEPLGVLGWRPTDVTDAYEGTHYLVTDGYCVGGVGAGALGSNWAILPAIENQVAGDVMQAYLAEGWSALRYDELEVRYSPTGGTDTGSSAADVGDFTVLLATYVHDTIGWWSPHEITLPGPGRIAFRYYVPQGRAALMYVDSLTIGDAPIGSIPFPAAGETVHWDAALSPVVFAGGTANVLAGGTVIVDPGVEVRLENGSTLNVEGGIVLSPGASLIASAGATLRLDDGAVGSFIGMAADPITLSGSQNIFTPGLKVFSGSTLTMEFVNADIYGWVSAGSAAAVSDCTFTRTSAGPWDVAGFRTYNGTLAVRSSSFTGGVINEEGGYLLLDDVTLDDSQLSLYRQTSPQPLLLDHLTARNVVNDAPIIVRGFDVLLGPNNVIESNLVPVRLDTGGLAPGSIVPATGNTLNHVAGKARIGSRATWAKVGVPYVLSWDTDIPGGNGRLTVEPGVTARFERGENTVSDAFAIEFFAELICRGTPEEPITFTAHDGAWGGLFFGDNSAKRPSLQHTIIENADNGVIATLCDVRLESCLLRDNGTAARSATYGGIIARGTRFLDNGIGVETSPGSGGVGLNAGQADLFGLAHPNSFAGNGAGLVIGNPSITQVDARHNWWGASNGPTQAGNPTGHGDSAAPTAEVLPFLAADPDDGDTAPRVMLQTLGDILEEGTRMILHWEVEDDGAIVAQRLEYSPHGSNPPLTVLIDDIPAGARSVAFTVPQSPPSSNTQLPVIRLVAIDDGGHEGWDEANFFTPYEDFELTFEVDPMPAVMRPGETAEVCWSINYGDGYLIVDDLDYAFSLGGTTVNCLSGTMTAPGVSTDTARIAIIHTLGAGGRVRYEYSDYFSIRPDPIIGDAPPVVSLDAPSGGSIPGGSTATIAWTASDDEALRSFDLQASYDGARSWHFIVRGLPATTTSYDWTLPASGGIPDVRLRVIARDHRFQASSDTTTISIGAGTCPGDTDGSGALDIDDIVNVILDFGYTGPAAPNGGDVNADGVVNIDDVVFIVLNFGRCTPI